MRHSYQINKEGLAAIQDYIQNERGADFEKWQSPALFLSPCTNSNGNGRLTVKVINDVWNDVCKVADIKGKTPHSARHAMGRYIIEKTGNIAAVQRQLGHKNAVYSMQYSRITDDELNEVLDGR
jgi:integrase